MIYIRCMEKCLQCSKQLKHVPGRKQKSFCDVNCRNKYFYAQRKKAIADAKALLVSLPPDYVTFTKVGVLTKEGEVKPIFPAPREKPKKAVSDELMALVDYAEAPGPETFDRPPVPKNTPDEYSMLETGRVAEQIKTIRAERIPKDRDTVLGRKAWAIEQQKRITELEKQIHGKD